MKSEKIILQSEYFTYPTKEERILSQKDYPKLENFEFMQISALKSILVDKMQFEEASTKHNLFHWDICLLNRLGLLNETYLYTVTYYNRLLSVDYTNYTSVEHVNQLMFNYHAEIFYYYFISTQDIIAQIIRLYYGIVIKGGLYLDLKFIKKVNNSNTRNSVITFLGNTVDAKEYRNGFAHRFTPTQKDFRTVVTNKDGKMGLSPGVGQNISPEKIINNIKSSLESLSILMTDLKKLMK